MKTVKNTLINFTILNMSLWQKIKWALAGGAAAAVVSGAAHEAAEKPTPIKSREGVEHVIKTTETSATGSEQLASASIVLPLVREQPRLAQTRDARRGKKISDQKAKEIIGKRIAQISEIPSLKELREPGKPTPDIPEPPREQPSFK